MLGKFVAGILSGYLGEYLENINTDQVTVSLWGGKVCLHHLQLRHDALRYLDAPLCVVAGTVEDLSISIPWSRLQTESVIITLNAVRLVVQHKHTAKYDEEMDRSEALMRKQRELDIFEEMLWLQHTKQDTNTSSAPTSREERSSQTFTERLKARILSNIQVEVTNVVVEYLHAPHVVCLRLQNVLIHPSSSSFAPLTTSSSEQLTQVFKLVRMREMEIFMRTSSSTQAAGAQRATTSLLLPLTAELRVEYRPIPLHDGDDALRCELILNHMSVELSAARLRAIHQLWHGWIEASTHYARHHHRPTFGVSANPRVWWHYAMEAVFEQLRQHRHHYRFSWLRYKQVKDQRVLYASIYARHQRLKWRASWLSAPSTEEVMELRRVEEHLPMDVLKLARRSAMMRVEAERAKQQLLSASEHDAVGANTPEVPQQQGLWARWFRRAAATTNVTAASEEERAEWANLRDASSLSAAQRSAISAELGLQMDEDEMASTTSSTVAARSINIARRWRGGLTCNRCSCTLISDDDHHHHVVVCASMEVFRVGATGFYGEALRAFAWMTIQSYTVARPLASSEMMQDGVGAHHVPLLSSGMKEADHDLTPTTSSRMMSVSDSYWREEINALEMSDACLFISLLCSASSVDERLSSFGLRVAHTSTVYARFDAVAAQEISDVVLQVCAPNTSTTEVHCNSSSSSSPPDVVADVDGDVSVYAFPFTRYALREDEQRDVDDLSSRRLTLMRRAHAEVELDLHVDLARIELICSDARLGCSSQVVVEHLHLINDVEQLRRRRGKWLAHSHGGACATPLGDAEDDWLSSITIKMINVSLRCSTTNNNAATMTWMEVLRPMTCTAVFHRNLLSWRQPNFPHLRVEMRACDDVRVSATRTSLAILCGSMSLCIDWMSSLMREVMLMQQDGSTASSSTSTSDDRVEVFRAHILCADSAFVDDDDDLDDVEDEPRTPLRCVVLRRGLLITHHQHRDAYADGYYELMDGGVHLRQRGDHVLDIFMENGGAAHVDAQQRKKAEHILFDVMELPRVTNNVALLRRALNVWMTAHNNHDDDDDDRLRVQAEEAMEVMEQQSHAVGSHHLRLRCVSVRNREELIRSIHAHVAPQRVLQLTSSVLQKFEECVPPSMKMQQMLDLHLNLPTCSLVIREDDDGGGGANGFELTVKDLNLQHQQRLQRQHNVVRCADVRMSSNKKKDGCDSSPSLLHVCGDVMMEIDLHLRPSPYLASKTTRIRIDGATPHAHHPCAYIVMSSDTVRAMELMFDAAGIVILRDLAWNIYPCTRWSSTSCSSSSRDDDVRSWRASMDGGALLLHDVELTCATLCVDVCFPDLISGDLHETLMPPTCGGARVCAFNANSSCVSWKQYPHHHVTSAIIHDPCLKAVSASALMRGDDDGMTMCMEPNTSPRNNNNKNESCVELCFRSCAPPPIISVSDYLCCDDVDGVHGFRYTRTLACTMHHLHLGGSYAQAMMLLELSRCGLAARVLWIAQRDVFALHNNNNNNNTADETLWWMRGARLPYTWMAMRKALHMFDVAIPLTPSNSPRIVIREGHGEDGMSWENDVLMNTLHINMMEMCVEGMECGEVGDVRIAYISPLADVRRTPTAAISSIEVRCTRVDEMRLCADPRTFADVLRFGVKMISMPYIAILKPLPAATDPLTATPQTSSSSSSSAQVAPPQLHVSMVMASCVSLRLKAAGLTGDELAARVPHLDAVRQLLDVAHPPRWPIDVCIRTHEPSLTMIYISSTSDMEMAMTVMELECISFSTSPQMFFEVDDQRVSGTVAHRCVAVHRVDENAQDPALRVSIRKRGNHARHTTVDVGLVEMHLVPRWWFDLRDGWGSCELWSCFTTTTTTTPSVVMKEESSVHIRTALLHVPDCTSTDDHLRPFISMSGHFITATTSSNATSDTHSAEMHVEVRELGACNIYVDEPDGGHWQPWLALVRKEDEAQHQEDDHHHPRCVDVRWSAQDGWSGCCCATQITLPSVDALRRLKVLWRQDGLQALVWLTTCAEERVLCQRGYRAHLHQQDASSSSAAQDDVVGDACRMDVVLCSPSISIVGSGTSPRTTLMAMKDLRLTRSNATTTSVEMPAISLRCVEEHTCLVQPFDARIVRRRRVDDDGWMWEVEMQSIMIGVPLQHYEELLGLVVHELLDADVHRSSSHPRVDVGVASPLFSAVGLGVELTPHLLLHKVGVDLGVLRNRTSSLPNYGMELHLRLASLQLQVQLHDAHQQQPSEVRADALHMHHEYVWRSVAREVVSQSTHRGAYTAAQSVVVGDATTCFDERITTSMHVDGLRIGLRGQRPLVELHPRADDVPNTNTTTTTSPSSLMMDGMDVPLTMGLHRRVMNHEETIFINLGTCVMCVDVGSIASVMGGIYAPFARLRSPHFAVREVRELEDDWVLDEDVVLSDQHQLHIRNTRFCCITMDGGGHHIHFDTQAGVAVMRVDDGMTLRICNAVLHTNHISMDEFVLLGEASYVAVDASSCRIVGDGNNDTNRTSTNDVGGIDASSREGSPSSATKAAISSFRRIISSGHLHMMLPEPAQKLSDTTTTANVVHGTGTTSQQLRRALSLRASMKSCVAVATQDGATIINATFDLTDFLFQTVLCRGDALTMLDARDLVARWAASAIISSELAAASPRTGLVKRAGTQQQQHQVATTQTRVELISTHEAEVYLRYSDVDLCVRAVKFAQETFMNVVGDVGRGEAATPTRRSAQHKTTHRSSSSSSPANHIYAASLQLPLVSLFIINDAVGAGVPLLHLRLANIATPQCESTSLTWMIHVTTRASLRCYDASMAAWQPCVEEVELTGKLMRSRLASTSTTTTSTSSSSSMPVEHEDMRDMILNTGIIRAYLSSTLIRNVRELVDLEAQLTAAMSMAHDDDVEGADAPFQRFTVVQHLLLDGDVRVSVDDASTQEAMHYRDVKNIAITHASSTHHVDVQLPQLHTTSIQLTGDGMYPLFLGAEGVLRHCFVELSTSRGKSTAELRTNISLRNDLPFHLTLGDGVGVLEPKQRLHIPVEHLRRRVVFAPRIDHPCQSCSLGVSYDLLADLHNQTFLCMCPVDTSSSSRVGDDGDVGRRAHQPRDGFCSVAGKQRYVYFMLRFAPRTSTHTSIGVFYAPITIQNHLPTSATMILSRERSSANNNNSNNMLERVAHLQLQGGASHLLTEVNPLHKIYVELVWAQPNGRVQRSSPSTSPVCLYSPVDAVDGASTSASVADAETGATTYVRIMSSSKSGEVRVACAYWIINRTPYHVQLAENVEGKWQLLAGLGGSSNGMLAPASSLDDVLLYNSTYARAANKRVELAIRVGMDPALGHVSSASSTSPPRTWSSWSNWMDVRALRSVGVVSCAHRGDRMDLSYSVVMNDCNARVVTFRPRWVFWNRSPHCIAYAPAAPTTTTTTTSSSRVGKLESGQIAWACLRRADADGATVSTPSLQISVVSPSSSSTHWSPPFVVHEEGKHVLQLHYQRLIPLAEYWPEVSAGRTPPALPPLSPKDVIDAHDGSVLVRVEACAVMEVMCYYEESSLIIDVAIANVPPIQLENRSDFVCHVQQQQSSMRSTIAPRRAMPYAWDNPALPHVLELVLSDGNGKRTSIITLNLRPDFVVANMDQLQQHVDAPNGTSLLLIRVRQLGHQSYAISITREALIDLCLYLPSSPTYAVRVEVSALYVLLRSASCTDCCLLSVRPIDVRAQQRVVRRRCAQSVGQSVEQSLELMLRVVQLDDERQEAKEKVVFQMDHQQETRLHVVRLRLCGSPILFLPFVEVSVASAELHLEDSFIFVAWKHLQTLMQVWSGSSSSTSTTTAAVADSLDDSRRWLVAQRGSRNRTFLDEMERIMFVEKIRLQPISITASLYRSPGAHFDPMWERFGIFSLFIRSVSEVGLQFDGQQHHRRCGAVRQIFMMYVALYKRQLEEQLPKFLNVVGIRNVKGYLSDLISLATDAETSGDRRRARRGRRGEAALRIDQREEEAATSSSSASAGGNSPLTTHNNNISIRSSTLVGRPVASTWAEFASSATPEMMLQHGRSMLAHHLRTEQIPTLHLRQAGALPCSEELLRRGINGRSGEASRCVCGSCDLLNALRQSGYDSGEYAAPLAHPSQLDVCWHDYLHHCSWEEFVRTSSVDEMMLYATAAVEGIVGTSANVLRLAQ